MLTLYSANGPKRRFPLTLNRFRASIFVLRLLAMEVLMSSISNKRLDAEFRSRVVALASWSTVQVKRVMRICISMLRKLYVFMR